MHHRVLKRSSPFDPREARLTGGATVTEDWAASNTAVLGETFPRNATTAQALPIRRFRTRQRGVIVANTASHGRSADPASESEALAG